MNKRTPTDDRKGKRPAVDRRAPAGGAQDPTPTLRKLKGALGRPLTLERKDGQLRVVLVDRRQTPQPETASLEARLGAALRAHLARRPDGSARDCAQLDLVSAAFENKGWAGVAALSGTLLGRATVQAEALAREESSELLALFIDRLRQIKAVVEAREERKAARRQALEASTVVVSEATHEEFEALQRSWEGTVPGGLGSPQVDTPGEPR